MKQREMAESIRAWAEKEESVRSLFLLGSHARNDATMLSDVDIVVETGSAVEKVLAQLQRLLPVQHHQSWGDGKLVLWVGPSMVKIDCWVVPNAEAYARYFWGSEPDSFDEEKWILLDRNGDLKSRLFSTAPSQTGYGDIDWLNKRFVEQLEAASKYHARSDAYRYMFSMQIAHDALVRLACHVAGEKGSLYLPKAGYETINSLLPQWKPARFGADGNLRKANEQKRNLLNCWKDLYQVAKQAGLHFETFSENVEFLDAVLRRDYFWNFRDLMDGTSGHRNRGKIYRGSCLLSHNKGEVTQLMKKHNIHWIVDLRAKKEIQDRKFPVYPKDFPVEVHHCPTWNETDRPSSWPQHRKGAKNDYPGTLRSMSPHVPKILELVASGKVGYIHCYAGKDRTGVICALILRILGYSKGELKDSYGLSPNADMEEVGLFLDWIFDEGHFQKLLQDLQISPKLIESVREAFSDGA